MLDQINNAPERASEMQGDLTALAQQLGAGDCLQPLCQATAALAGARVQNLADLERFLESYATGVLLPHELPAIAKAYQYAATNQVRELIALDQELARASAFQPFATASATVGRMQLRRLRPLRGERLAQRYLAAVDAGEAQGWHTLVFGLVLAVYSLPLRQGLIHFAHQTLGGFIESARHRLTLLAPAERERLHADQTIVIRTAVDRVLSDRPAIFLHD